MKLKSHSSHLRVVSKTNCLRRFTQRESNKGRRRKLTANHDPFGEAIGEIAVFQMIQNSLRSLLVAVIEVFGRTTFVWKLQNPKSLTAHKPPQTSKIPSEPFWYLLLECTFSLNIQIFISCFCGCCQHYHHRAFLGFQSGIYGIPATKCDQIIRALHRVGSESHPVDGSHLVMIFVCSGILSWWCFRNRF